MKLIPKIRERRMERHLTQRELSEIVPINQSQLSAIESGKTTPSIKICFTIAKVLDCKVDDLYEVSE